MSTTYPTDERILSYETLDLAVKTEAALIYNAPDGDFCAKTVILDRRNFEAAGQPIPETIIVSVSFDGLK
ncbi:MULTISPECIES: hypothetical protein [unclassified Ensifer]|uniref:hypothetical protein n=1 Tax=unclassified Ensifer TaxID=2633371 RepID=UPI000813C80B|nr:MULTISPECIES: hypothetical protein [unclassified Ensifer]OCP21970.1 hypothetical protein BC361_25725 [Ensifer sp. LC54]OCP23250.1 hypothetical protein BC363_25040 [Ensifer sp. LC384]